MTKRPRSYQLTPDLVSRHAGGPVVCVDTSALGRTFSLYAERPSAATNLRVTRLDDGTIEWSAHPEAPMLGPEAVTPPALTRVDIRGALEQRAGYHDECGGWSDGHDAVCERLCAAFESGDVLLVVDSPGGACAGLQEAVRRALEVKAQHGRRVTAYADEMIGSAAFWWVACVADELYLPPAGIVGSIGARAAHVSIAGALAKEGVEYTPFCWPDDGKIALATERPLSDLGRERGNRDVNIAGEAFAAAVAGSLGKRTGLTVDAIRALRADALTGALAVKARLADGVASLEDVTEYALAMAAGGDGESTMKLRTAGDEPDKMGAEGEPPPDDKGAEMPPADKAECAGCHMANPSHAKYCLGCGSPMGAEDDDGGEEAEGDEPPPSSRRPPAEAKAEPPPPKEGASLASILGCRAGASDLALRTAAVKQRQVIDYAAKLTGQSTMAGIIGGLDALARDAAATADARAKLRSEQRKNNARERMDLLSKLEAAGVHSRGELFEDVIDDKTGVRSVVPSKLWGAGPEGRSIANLRGYASTKLANIAPKKRTTPFEPDRDAARAAADKAGGKTFEQRVEAAKNNPTVKTWANRPGQQATLEQLAETYVRQGFDLQGASS